MTTTELFERLLKYLHVTPRTTRYWDEETYWVNVRPKPNFVLRLLSSGIRYSVVNVSYDTKSQVLAFKLRDHDETAHSKKYKPATTFKDALFIKELVKVETLGKKP